MTHRLLLAFALAASAQMHPIEEIVEAARTGSPRIGDLLSRGLPRLQGRDGALVWGQEFLFAVESDSAASVAVDHQPAAAMTQAPGTRIWYKLMTLRMGMTHHYEYFANGKAIASYEAGSYNAGSYPLTGAERGTLSPERKHVSRIYPGMEASYWTYANPGIDKVRGAPVMIWQDGETIAGDIDLARLRLQIVSDNLVHRKMIPPMVHVLIAPGNGPDAKGTRMRSIQYDTVSDRYGRYVLEEILPEVQKSYKLRTDAYSVAIAGASSGAICAFNAAWNFPDRFSRVLSHIGSYVALQWKPEEHLDGGYIVPFLVRRERRKNLRVWLSEGSDDIESNSGSWPLQNIQLANSLKMRGYDFHFRFGTSLHAIAQGAMDLPESLTWLWRGYDPAKTAETFEMEPEEKAKPLFRVKIANRDAW